jgi:hypothetical protein
VNVVHQYLVWIEGTTVALRQVTEILDINLRSTWVFSFAQFDNDIDDVTEVSWIRVLSYRGIETTPHKPLLYLSKCWSFLRCL